MLGRDVDRRSLSQPSAHNIAYATQSSTCGASEHLAHKSRDEAIAARSALLCTRYMVYGKEGVFDADRLIDLLRALEAGHPKDDEWMKYTPTVVLLSCCHSLHVLTSSLPLLELTCFDVHCAVDVFAFFVGSIPHRRGTVSFVRFARVLGPYRRVYR